LPSLSNVSFGFLFNYSFPKKKKFLDVLLSPFYNRRTQIKVFGNRVLGRIVGYLREGESDRRVVTIT
jgi:hypothetical protein